MQHLDWRQAVRVFEQLRTLEPDDMMARKNLIDLNIRLNQIPQATAEIDSLLEHLRSTGKRAEAIPFLEDLIKEYPKQPFLRQALAEEYRQAGRPADAVFQYDELSVTLLDAGDRNGALQAIEAIIAMNPPNIQEYQTALEEIKSHI
jgi:predicted Zn-dependent protease